MEWFLELFGIDMPTIFKPIKAIIEIIVSLYTTLIHAFAYVWTFNPIIGSLLLATFAFLLFYGLLKLLKALVPFL